jgi:hypothetical protein
MYNQFYNSVSRMALHIIVILKNLYDSLIDIWTGM